MPALVSSQLRQEGDLFLEQWRKEKPLGFQNQCTQHGQELGIGMKIGGLTENLHMEWFDFSKPFLPRFLHRTLVAFQARQNSLLEKPSRS